MDDEEAPYDPLRQDPLPDMPTEPAPALSPAARARLRRVKAHTPCDDCIADIHARGVHIAPYPGRVRWEWAPVDGPARRLCERHKDERGTL